jgi:tRNA-dihydrouridine synthase B
MKIGSLTLTNNLLMAPMAGVSDLPCRVMMRRHGAALCFTEMVSANGLVRGMERSFRYLDSSREDKPLGVQIFGSDPDILSEAARIVTGQGADVIDINMGCPVKKVVRKGAGAALLKEPLKIGAIVGKVREATKLPLTVKIRAGWNHSEINAPEIAKIAESAGADALILHPRTATDGFGGQANWKWIGEVKECVRIPVIGNGDIWTPEDALSMIKLTGCDGVMLGRGALGNPWIFRNIIGRCEGRNAHIVDLNEREETIREHLNAMVDLFGEETGLKHFRRHLFWYTKGFRDGSRFRKAACSIICKDELFIEIRRFFDSLA